MRTFASAYYIDMKKLLFILIALMLFTCSACTLLSSHTQSTPSEAPAKASSENTTSLPSEAIAEASPSASFESLSEPTTATPAPVPSPELSEEEYFKMLAPTASMSFEELVGDNGIYDELTTFPETGTYKMVVDLKWQIVTAYTKDEKGEYTIPVRYMVCSSGKKGNATGTFEMGEHKVRFGKFVNDGVYGQYWSNINKRIYFHSILYSKRNANSYTSAYKHLGTKASHGCIRLTVPDARWIYYHVAPGSLCEIRTGSADDAEMAEVKEKLVLPEFPGRGKKLGVIPNTDNWNIFELNAELCILAENDSSALHDASFAISSPEINEHESASQQTNKQTSPTPDNPS